MSHRGFLHFVGASLGSRLSRFDLEQRLTPMSEGIPRGTGCSYDDVTDG